MASARTDTLKKSAIVAGVAIVVAAAGLGLLRPLSWLGSRLASSAAAPLHALVAGFNRWSDVRDAAVPDAAVLVRENEALKAETAKIRTLASEVEELKAALGYRERHADRLVVARVVAESADRAFVAMRIDRGSADGLTEGQEVIVGDGVLIGRVSGVGRYSATVMLLTDSRSRVAVSAGDVLETIGVLAGDRGLSMSVSLVPQSVTLNPGDVIVTSGLEDGIRRGLAVGVVDKVEKSDQAPFQSATISPFVTARHPSVVQVIVPSAEVRPAEGL
jgi:rod shape-determining protein MreC